jgi:predicted permease
MGWYRRFVNVLRPNRVSADIQRELEFHMVERADELMAGGMSEIDARREARRRFGNPGVQQERTRDADLLTWLESFGNDVRYAWRNLRASPGFALVAILSLGLGIGANTAIFSLLNAVVLRTLPVERPDELVHITFGEERGSDGVILPGEPGASEFTNPIWEQIRDRQDVFTGAFAFGRTDFNLASGGEVRPARGNWVSGDYFSTLGVSPAAGRLLSRGDDVRGCPPVAVLSYGFWQSEFGGSPSVVGKTVSLDRTPYQIVGVADRSFFGVNVGESIQVYVPLCRAPALDSRSDWFVHIMARPKPGVSLRQAAARMAALAPIVFESTVAEDWGPSEKAQYREGKLAVVSGATGLSDVRREYRRALTVLMAAVAVVLLIACVNVANLLLSRATVRAREMAIRMAVGAGRRRIARQLLTESALLAGVGAAVGVVLARWGTSLLVGLLTRSTDSVFLDLGVDGRILAFTVTVAVATGMLFGLAPAWRATRVDPQTVLKANGRGVLEGHTRFTVGKALVIAQIALSLVLVVGAGLLLGSFRNLTTLDPGFTRNGVLLVGVDLANAGYSPAELNPVHDDLLRRFRALPGVRGAGAAELTPISGMGWNGHISVDGHVSTTSGANAVWFNQVSDGFFAAMGTQLIAGRDFDQRDRPTTPPVAVVNETVARRLFPGTSPIGKYYRQAMHDRLDAPVQIVGVVKDAKYRELREESQATVYLAMGQARRSSPFRQFELRTDGPVAALVPGVKRAVAEVNRSITIGLTPLSQQLDASLTRDRLMATLSGFFGVVALLLAMVGLYGTLSYNLARRRNEIGIRIALGAARSRVVQLVLGEVARMVIAGLILGAVGALVSTRLVRSLLYGVSASDPATVVVSVAILTVVAIAAGALPAWRAARVDPIAALREE